MCGPRLLRLATAFKSHDLPTFDRPTIATPQRDSGSWPVSLADGRKRMASGLDMLKGYWPYWRAFAASNESKMNRFRKEGIVWVVRGEAADDGGFAVGEAASDQGLANFRGETGLFLAPTRR